MYPYRQEYMAKMHQWELQREAERQRLARMAAPHRNVVLLAVKKLGALWHGLRIHEKQVELSPRPITGNL